jgi:6-phosphogluconolactonase (cycloisomerase 2 family)
VALRSLVLALAALALAPAAAEAAQFGTITFGNCLSQNPGSAAAGTGPCAQGNGLNAAYSTAPSPDGRHVYAAAVYSDAVAVFSRDSSTGALTQASCVNETGSDGCADGNALEGANWVAASPDGKSVYVASRDSDSIAAFSRDSTSGALIQIGCVNADGSAGCADGRALDFPYGLVVSADGARLYAASYHGDALLVFDRNTTTGAITQLAGSAGCIRDTITSPHTGEDCAAGRGLDGVFVPVVSPEADGTENVYGASRSSDAVVTFERTAGGTLQQVDDPATPQDEGCIANQPRGACIVHHALETASSLAVSPDGRNVYVTANRGYAVTAYARDGGSGRLAPLPDPWECVADELSLDVCREVRGLTYTTGITVSPDGRHVYASSAYRQAIAVLERKTAETQGPGEPPLGALRQVPDDPATTTAAGAPAHDGCLSWRGTKWFKQDGDYLEVPDSGGYCLRSATLYYPSYDIDPSANGRNLYLASVYSDAVTALNRNADPTQRCLDPHWRDTDGDAHDDVCDANDDADARADAEDNCSLVPNDDQADLDGDRAGDACDLDDDGDGTIDAKDNCRTAPNGDQANSDLDPEGDACDADDDNDAVVDAGDNCSTVANLDQADADRSGGGDACDDDDDNDRLSDEDEARLRTDRLDRDSDDDGLGDDERGTHPARFDSDRDGLSDGLERGLRRGIADPEGPVAGTDGRRFRPDRDPRSRTRPNRRDTDRDGLADGREDRNRNGRRDRGEFDPRRRDTDRDGIRDGRDRPPRR